MLMSPPASWRLTESVWGPGWVRFDGSRIGGSASGQPETRGGVGPPGDGVPTPARMCAALASRPGLRLNAAAPANRSDPARACADFDPPNRICLLLEPAARFRSTRTAKWACRRERSRKAGMFCRGLPYDPRMGISVG